MQFERRINTATGKTTLALNACAAAARHGPVIYYDMERKLSHEWARAFGARVGDNFTLVSPDDSAQALNEILNLLDKNDQLGIALIVLDSIATLSPTGKQYVDKAQTQLEDFRNVPMARLARFLTPFYEQFRPLLAASGAAFLAINQLRVNIGGYGDPHYTPGGNAKDFTSAIELRMYAPTNIERTVSGEKTLVGRIHKGKTKKNQTAMWPRELKVPVKYTPRIAIDHSLEMYFAGVEGGVIVNEDGKKPSGVQMAFYGDLELGKGQSAVATYFDKHPDMVQQMYRDLLQQETLTSQAQGEANVVQESELHE